MHCKPLFIAIVLAGISAHAEFKVVGYAPSWSINVNTIKYPLYTHINYSFVLPSDGNGGLGNVPSAGKLTGIVTQAHAKGVKVCISIGGWNGGNDQNFETMAANAAARANFTDNVMKLVRQYNLDGVDMDWEYPDPGTSGANNQVLTQLLADSLHAAGKIITAAVISSGGTGNGWTAPTFAMVDFLNLMAYDGGQHSLMSQAEGSLTYWRGRGLPKEKAVLGMLFYGRGGTGPSAYRQIVAADPANAYRDEYNGHKYNGIPTTKKKTALAIQNGGGMMFWEMSQDTDADATSLLVAISQTMDSLLGPSVLRRQPSAGELALLAAGTQHIRYSLPAEGTVIITLTDLKGRARELFRGRQGPGPQLLPLSPSFRTAGVHVLSIRQGEKTATRKMAF